MPVRLNSCTDICQLHKLDKGHLCIKHKSVSTIFDRVVAQLIKITYVHIWTEYRWVDSCVHGEQNLLLVANTYFPALPSKLCASVASSVKEIIIFTLSLSYGTLMVKIIEGKL